MAKPWGGVAAGAWALDAEAEERDLAAAAVPPPILAGQPPQSFPSLRESAATKTKKKKPTPIPLHQFQAAPAVADIRLPSGPKDRSPEELEAASRGGFRSFTGGPRSMGDEPRAASRSSSEYEGPSRADEVDDWKSKKSFTPMEPRRTGGSGYSSAGSSRSDDLDSWADRRKSFAPPPPSRYPIDTNSGTGERRRLVLDPPKRDVSVPGSAAPAGARPSLFGAARPREEVLVQKGIDPKKVDAEIDAKLGRPGSSHSSRPSSVSSSRPGSPGSQGGDVVTEFVPKPRAKVNPFGDAKPREVKLQEKGIDWRKMDLELEHRGVDRAETEGERLMKEEINHLKVVCKEVEEGLSDGDLPSIKEQIHLKEKELEVLMLQLDDKLKFSQRNSFDSRPGSGSGRARISSDRPPSQSGRSEDSRSVESTDRPRSRGGIGDGWSTVVDDRRGISGGRDRRLSTNAFVERSTNRGVQW